MNKVSVKIHHTKETCEFSQKQLPRMLSTTHSIKLDVQRKIFQGKPVFLPEMEEAVLDALRNDRFLDGENVVKFEEEFARMVGTKFAVSMNSGTTALAFILMALKSQGKRYLTTPWSFIATANAILHAGGEPVFADISLNDYCLDAIKAKEKLDTGNISGIVPVHIYGHPVEYDEFDEMARKYQIPIIEDACQAHGAKYKGRKVGSLGIAAAFSFYPSKNMSVLGDGGMVTTNDENIARTVSKLRNSGRISRYEHDILGYTARLNTVNAAIGRVQLRYLGEWNEKRSQIAQRYALKLQNIDETRLPPKPTEDVEPVYHQFVIRVPNKQRDRLKAFLESKGIETGIHYPIPIHLQPLYRKLFGYSEGAFSNSELLAGECLSLPMHPFLTDDETDYVAEEISEFFEQREVLPK
jgi:perosamine synthetase